MSGVLHGTSISSWRGNNNPTRDQWWHTSPFSSKLSLNTFTPPSIQQSRQILTTLSHFFITHPQRSLLLHTISTTRLRTLLGYWRSCSVYQKGRISSGWVLIPAEALQDGSTLWTRKWPRYRYLDGRGLRAHQTASC